MLRALWGKFTAATGGENREPMSPGRMSAFVAGLGLLALVGIFLFSADRDFTGFGAADTAAVAQTPAANTQRIEDYIPTPVHADVPPLTLADLAREGGDKWIASQVPTPEPAGVAPITLKDVGPVTASASAPAQPATASTQPATTPAQPATAAQPEAPLTGKDLVKAPVAATLASTDTIVAEKLRDLLALRGERYFNRKNERAAAEQFYRDRGFVPLWVEKGAETARATAAFAYLRGIEADGLDPADYPMPNFKAIADADGLAEAELKFTAAIFDFARHAQTGRVHFSRITYDILYYPTAPEPAEVLARMAGARNMAEALDGYQPPHDAYKALKGKLAEARGQNTTEPEIVRVGDGPSLKLGMKDPRVASLRKRLKVAGDESDTNYDATVVEAVKKFQQQAGLNADGMVGPATLRVLNGAPRRTNVIDLLVANLERWRWAPRDLGKVHVIVNIPDYTLKVVRDNQMVWTTRIVVGKPGNLATPITSAMMTHITVNPTWNVPPSIIQNEYLPALQQDPDAMERIGLKLRRNPDGTIHIYQLPGDNNALGRIRFNFPNKFLVYQHDTPDKKLFALDKRAFSHGCMRVLDPVKYAEVLLSIALPKEGYTQDRIRKMFGPGEVDIRLPSQIPVHLTYQSAFVDEAGKLQIREDVYGRDARLLAVLKGSERRVADIAVERRPATTINRDALRLPDNRWAGGRGGNFFNWFLSR